MMQIVRSSDHPSARSERTSARGFLQWHSTCLTRLPIRFDDISPVGQAAFWPEPVIASVETAGHKQDFASPALASPELFVGRVLRTTHLMASTC